MIFIASNRFLAPVVRNGRHDSSRGFLSYWQSLSLFLHGVSEALEGLTPHYTHYINNLKYYFHIN
jgi:hypothetical protein